MKDSPTTASARKPSVRFDIRERAEIVLDEWNATNGNLCEENKGRLITVLNYVADECDCDTAPRAKVHDVPTGLLEWIAAAFIVLWDGDEDNYKEISGRDFESDREELEKILADREKEGK